MKRLGLLLAVLAGSLIWSGTAGAANGDLITIRTFSQNCNSGIGVGIAFDGTNIWYSCYASNPDLLRANPNTGVVDATYNIDGGLGALAYDATRNALWAGPAGGSVLNAIQLINLDAGKNVTGSSIAFSGPGDFLDDGLAFDASDDSLYISPDGSVTIDHYTSGGAFLGTASWAGNACYNSGLAIGGTLLYEGSDGCNRIWVADKSNPALSTFDFASPGGVRDEDLECDPVTFAPTQVMWSMEAYDTNFLGDGSARRASVFEIQPDTCGVGGLPAFVFTLNPPQATNAVGTQHTVTAHLTANGVPFPGQLVSFSVVSGPNTGQSSPPGCTPPTCTTDANGDVSWTYLSNGVPGTDVIEACFTFEHFTQCTRAKKTWVDLTPPTASCTETTNPAGGTVPPAGNTTLPGAKGGQNEDGFYIITFSDNVAVASAVIQDSASSFSTPVTNGEKDKITQAPGGTPNTKPMAGVITQHITLNGDALLVVTDTSGNTTTVSCKVPPPPK